MMLGRHDLASLASCDCDRRRVDRLDRIKIDDARVRLAYITWFLWLMALGAFRIV